MIVCAYPDSIHVINEKSSLVNLRNILDEIFPRYVSLHLLPFYPSCGDGGFSATSWTALDPQYGCENELKLLASSRNLIVDAIYNHIGIKHPLFQAFLQEPTNYKDLFHVFDKNVQTSCKSPRGSSVLRKWNVQGEEINIWQTFGQSAVDINLENKTILNEIEKHLNYIIELGIKGVRVDAIAYFGKKLSGPVRHSESSYNLGRSIIKLIEQKDLLAIGQLDSDADALKYFPIDQGYNVPIVDFAFPAILAKSILSQSPMSIFSHIQDTWNLNSKLIRAPRTHDGILLKTNRLALSDRNWLVDHADKNNIPIRTIENIPYELNCSLGHLLGSDHTNRSKRIIICIAISIFSPGIPYLYLPAILGFVPEVFDIKFDDPRSLNRIPIPIEAVQDSQKEHIKWIKKLFSSLSFIFDSSLRSNEQKGTIDLTSENCLTIVRYDLNCCMTANFSISKSAYLDQAQTVSDILFEIGLNNTNIIAPLGVVITRIQGDSH